MKEHFRVIAIDETDNWDEATLAGYHIAKAFGLYVIREGEGTHCASVTVDSFAMALSNEFIFDFDLDPSLRAKVIDENIFLEADRASFGETVLDALRSKPSDVGLTHEGLDDCYISYVDVKKHDPRFLSERVTFTHKAGDYKGGSKGTEYHDAIWDEAREYFSGNACEPDILYPPVYLAYQAEKTAKRRALNLRPLDGALSYGPAQLPLFVAAAKRMAESEVILAHWFPEYVERMYARHPDELAAADAARP